MMANATTTSPAKRSPAVQIRRGDTVTSVFTHQRPGKNGNAWTSYTVSVQRSYYDAEAKQRSYSDSLFDADLLPAAEGLRQAYDWVEAHRRSRIIAAKPQPEAKTTDK